MVERQQMLIQVQRQSRRGPLWRPRTQSTAWTNSEFQVNKHQIERRKAWTKASRSIRGSCISRGTTHLLTKRKNLKLCRLEIILWERAHICLVASGHRILINVLWLNEKASTHNSDSFWISTRLRPFVISLIVDLLVSNICHEFLHNKARIKAKPYHLEVH